MTIVLHQALEMGYKKRSTMHQCHFTDVDRFRDRLLESDKKQWTPLHSHPALGNNHVKISMALFFKTAIRRKI